MWKHHQAGERKKVKIKKNNQKSLLYTNFNFFMFSVSLTHFYVDFQKLILHNVVVTTVFYKMVKSKIIGNFFY